MGPKAAGLQGQFLFSPVSQPVARQWLPAGRPQADWLAGRHTPASSEIYVFGVTKNH